MSSFLNHLMVTTSVDMNWVPKFYRISSNLRGVKLKLHHRLYLTFTALFTEMMDQSCIDRYSYWNSINLLVNNNMTWYNYDIIGRLCNFCIQKMYYIKPFMYKRRLFSANSLFYNLKNLIQISLKINVKYLRVLLLIIINSKTWLLIFLINYVSCM